MLRPVQVVGGEQTLYAVTHDGKVYATGAEILNKLSFDFFDIKFFISIYRSGYGAGGKNQKPFHDKSVFNLFFVTQVVWASVALIQLQFQL